MSKRPAAVYLKDGTPLYCVGAGGVAKCAKLQSPDSEVEVLCPHAEESPPTVSDAEELFSALTVSDCKLLQTPRPSFCRDTKVKFRTQFNPEHEGSLMEYAVYRVFEEVKLSGQSESVRTAQYALQVVLRVHFPGSFTLDAVPFLSGGAYRLAFGKDARLDDFQISACLRCFSYAKNQVGTADAMRTLLLALMREQLIIATTVVLKCTGDVPALLGDGDKYTLLREAVVMSKGVEWLPVLPRYLWPEGQMIPEGLRSPDSEETLLDVWVEKSRSLSKLVVLLHTQKPTEALRKRFITICSPMLRRRLDEMAVGEANVYVSCTQCFSLITTALVGRTSATGVTKGAE